jgi:hypothetical protein
MDQTYHRRPWRARASWALSVGLHLSMAGAIWLILTHASQSEPQLLNTVVKNSSDEYEIIFDDEPPRRTKPPSLFRPRASIGTMQVIPDSPPAAVMNLPEPPRVPRSPGPLGTSGNGGTSSGIAQAGFNGSRDGAGSLGSGSTPTPTRLPVPLSVKSVVFVVDCSASMGQEDRLDIARRQLVALLKQMGSGTRFQVVFYSHSPRRFAGEGLIAVTDGMVAYLDQFMLRIEPEGENDHLAALRDAISLEPEMICLLTDADDLTLREVREITTVNRGRCRICAVTIGSSPREAMRQLTQANLGSCRDVGTD